MRATFLSAATFLIAITGFAHDEPDPIAHWIFSPKFVKDGQLEAQAGPSGALPAGTMVPEDKAAPLGFMGKSALVLNYDPENAESVLPKESFTVSAWLTVDEPQRYGGVIGYLQDNGSFEKGWVLGYDDQRFTFALATEGADDGDGKMTYLHHHRYNIPSHYPLHRFTPLVNRCQPQPTFLQHRH